MPKMAKCSKHNKEPMSGTEQKSIFQRPFWVSFFALTAAIVWGWAYPLIKLGFAEFEITQAMTGSKMLFAGIRFACSGIIILAIALCSGKHLGIKSANGERSYLSLIYSVMFILAYSLVNTTLHYTFFYIGLSYSQGARAAILNSMSVFAVVIMACIMFKSDKLTMRKIVGCVIGICGILALNLGSEDSGSFSFMGDGMIILNALCGASAALMTRGLNKRIDVFVGTGYSLGVGGALLVVPGLMMGGTLPHVTMWGCTILLLLIGISTLGFSLYNKLLTCNPVGKVTIYNSLIPVVGAVTSCLCLGEPFYWKYVVAGTLATAGIYIINKGKK